MFSQLQNVVSSRELFNSNPCRDFWESQSCSQTASGSQNSQGSYELFSQPLRQSQHKGTAIDRWSQPGGSQQTNEEDSVKYYLKYMTKPSLFGDKDKPGSEKAVNRVASYREHIEIQKKKATERDERDMLDSFIALLKDYQKEVKSALDSFKSNVDSTLAKKAEQIAAGADQSTELIAKLKEELKEHFLKLRKEMEEHQLLRETIAKQETKIVEQETQIKLLQDQLHDCKEREKSATLKEQSYFEREKEIHRRLQELEKLRPSILRDTPPLSQKLITGNETRIEAINQSQPDHGSRFSSVVRHHLLPRGLDQGSMVPQASCQPHLVPSATHINQQQYQRLTNGPPLFQTNDIMLPINAQGVVSMQNPTEPLPTHQHDTRYLPVHEKEQNSYIAHAKVFPVQQFNVHGGDRCAAAESYTCNKNDQETNLGSAALSTKADKQLSRSAAVSGNTFTSPGKNLIPYVRTANWPKQSPVATVYPQVHVKTEEGQKKSLTQPGKQKGKVEDPFDIFTFDLTDSPEIANNETTESSIMQSKARVKQKRTTTSKVEKEAVKTYNTRSRQETSRKIVAGSVDNKSKTNTETRNECEDVTTSTHVSVNASERSLKVAHTRTTNDNHISDMSQIKSGNASEKPKQTVFRRALAEKRKLPAGPSFFDMVDGDDDISIKKITESFRKHTQQRKIRKMNKAQNYVQI